MSDLKTENEYYYTLFNSPILVTKTILVIIIEQFTNFIKFLIRNYFIILFALFVVIVNIVENPFSGELSHLRKILYTCSYWILLGIASSIGLGTGLHTFVLYLGPHIAKVTMAANECSYFPVMNPSRWEFEDFLPCETRRSEVSTFSEFLEILSSVHIEAFMWGLGTAIGELPPYFMALGASKAGKSNEELDEIIESESKSNKGLSLMERAKIFLFEHLKKHGFITVLLCASVSSLVFN